MLPRGKVGVVGQVGEVYWGKAEVAPSLSIIIKSWEIWGTFQEEEDACETEGGT